MYQRKELVKMVDPFPAIRNLLRHLFSAPLSALPPVFVHRFSL